MERKVVFRGKALPLALLAPQLLITIVFFFWPAGQAVWFSFLRQDAFGIRSTFVGLENFTDLFADPLYLETIRNTVVFSTGVTVIALATALLLAVLADRQIRGSGAYRTLLIWPYAIAPAVAAVLWIFLFHPQIGLVGRALNGAGIPWDYKLNGNQAMLMVILASAWKQVSYNFIFFLAGLQSIPKSVLEAAAIDGARPAYRFWTITFPLLSPTTFFLLVVNLVYAFFDTFGVIDALTKGGPAKATETLIYRAYVDGRVNLDIGLSSAQSVVLMLVVIALTAIQFRFIERRVHY
ncbi:sn-glycerol-3-phosphate ABC transporter permease UgpA [Paracraurococcus ruber]|uniref:sn-glycerol-3-phosphate transport system permease protein UgpA n=1 Tax=Paracraurococcus ruber TaxID=77675 RepID=A0ABS1D0L4_9PROT|nr:sn-glycerol-3-phosphate ABC transporter permease UgpA [Paracraurococcus ruber]MBK1660235.1 glycerol-3-phosphate transporter permease [Paracraurococcus ruber]TDG32294.1 sn-glycerol-3-phosphate ABC transporter permease UgpA [Paracraurococcus ruber]